MDWIRIVQTAIDRIEDDLQDNLDADILSEEQYVSSYYFQKMFSSLCDCTVMEYIRNRRLTVAGYEISDSTRTVLDIALSYGYDSAEGFTKAFTRFHGITPQNARKNHANLKAFDRISLIHKLTGGKIIMGNIGERGYIVKETGAVYYTNDMDATIKWFTDVLGWYGQIDNRDENGNGMYGCVNNIPMEIEALHIAPFTGIHMFYGEPEKKMVGFMMVQGIDELYSYVKKHGWNNITEVVTEPWNSKTCSITTIDGSILTFFEVQ